MTAPIGPDAPAEGPPSAAFDERTAALARRAEGAARHVEAARDRVRHLRAGLAATPGAPADLGPRLDQAARRLEEVGRSLSGDPVLGRRAEADAPSVRDLVGRVTGFHWDTTGPPTATQQASVARAEAELQPLVDALVAVVDVELPAITATLDAAGGPWTPR
ncbi:MAG: hypothetical protein AAGD35_11495 [Actinomycetota bacterium]